MLDDAPQKDGVLVVMPSGKSVPTTAATPAPAPASPAPPAATQPSPRQPPPAPALAATYQSLDQAVQSALGQGLYVTLAAPGQPGAAIADDVARQCSKPAADVRKAVSTLERRPTALDDTVNGAGGSGQIWVINVPVGPALPDAIGCLATLAPQKPVALEVLAQAKELGPQAAQAIDSAGFAALETQANDQFGDPQRRWRRPTTIELLAIMQSLYDRDIWGPQGARYWTGDSLADGSGLIVDAKTENKQYRAAITPADAAAKAIVIWVRDRTN